MAHRIISLVPVLGFLHPPGHVIQPFTGHERTLELGWCRITPPPLCPCQRAVSASSGGPLNLGEDGAVYAHKPANKKEGVSCDHPDHGDSDVAKEVTP